MSCFGKTEKISSNSQKLKFAYWQEAGKGQNIRFLLEFLNLPYEEKTYSDKNPEEWFQKDKPDLKKIMEFPNIPYIINPNTNFAITENLAITKYLPILADKPELNGKTSQDQFKIDEIKGICDDLCLAAYFASFKKGEEKTKDFEEKIWGKLERILELKKEGWWMGYLSVADFYLYNIGQQIKGVFPGLFDKRVKGRLDGYFRQFEDIQQIRNYIKSDKFIAYEQFQD